MTKLNRIQSEIKQLEGGRFQNLCDRYLYLKKNMTNITALGSMDGTDKTTKGIPDTYFIDEESKKYILVMYGTHQDFVSKVQKDIEDAIQKSNLDKEDIQEIICCHTSSNLPVAKDKELRELVHPIQLTFYGIDTLSHELLKIQYQGIAKEFLDISESTEQVWNAEQFVAIHDKSKTNAPLNIQFVSETQDASKQLTEELPLLNILIDDLNDHQIILLSGMPGVGKTRIAIELFHHLPTDCNTICVKSNSMPVYQDIKDALDDQRLNYLFLDDANNITNFDAIINLLKLEKYEQRLKIIITVRDYAASKIVDQTSAFKTKHHVMSPMSDENIEMLIKSMHTFSPSEFRKIRDLSQNNPRIAVIAAIMIKNKESFEDGSEVMDRYYKKIIEENSLTNNEIISLFILSFKQKINLLDLENINELLKLFNLTSEVFLKNLHYLHDKELCDIFQNMAAKVSDQSLSDFIMIDFIANNKAVKIRDIFKELYPAYDKEIAEMLIGISEFKNNDDWMNYLIDEINFIYREIIKEKEEELFLKQYNVLIPVETVLFTLKKIQECDSNDIKVSLKDFEKSKKNIHVTDPIIQILHSLSNSKKFDDAGKLLIKYFEKKKDTLFQVYSVINTDFNIEEHQQFSLRKRFVIFNIFLSQEKIDETTALLIISISEEFLKFSTEQFNSRNKKIHFTRYDLVDGDYLIKFHELVFNTIKKIYELEYTEINNYIDKILFKYPVIKANHGFPKTISSDLSFIKKLFFCDFIDLTPRKKSIAYELYKSEELYNLSSKSFQAYKPTQEQIIYEIFGTRTFDYRIEKITQETEIEERDYDQKMALRTYTLTHIFKAYSSDLISLFNSLEHFQSDDLLYKFEIEESIGIILMSLNMNDRVIFLSALLNSDFIIRSSRFDYYLNHLSYEQQKIIFDKIDKEIDVRWHLSHLAALRNIDETSVKMLIKFLKDLKFTDSISVYNISHFINYIEKNPSVFDFFEDKYSKNEVSEIFFFPHYTSEDIPKRLIKTVGSYRMQNLYLNFTKNNFIDRSGHFYRALLEEADSTFIYNYLYELNNFNSYSPTDNFSLSDTWNSRFAEEGIIAYLNYLIDEDKLFLVGLNPYLEEVLKANIDGSYQLIETKIKNTPKENILVKLYDLALQIFNDESMLTLFELLKKKEISDLFFRELHLTMRSKRWSGSMVPLIDSDIAFLDKISELFNSLEDIHHLAIINIDRDILKERKKKELLSDFLDE